MGRVVPVSPSVIILLVVVVSILHRAVIGALGRVRNTNRVSRLVTLPDLLQHEYRIHVVLVLQMGDQILIVLPKTHKKTLLLHPGQLSRLESIPMLFLQCHANIHHPFIVILWRFPVTLLQPTELGIQVPEGYGSSVYHVHLLQDFLQGQVPFLITGLIVLLGFTFQGGEHGLFDLSSGVLLRDVLLYFQPPVGIS